MQMAPYYVVHRHKVGIIADWIIFPNSRKYTAVWLPNRPVIGKREKFEMKTTKAPLEKARDSTFDSNDLKLII